MKILISFLFFTNLLFSKYLETNLIVTSGVANEYVNYDSGKTLSKLVWKYDNVGLLNFNLAYPIIKSQQFNFLINYSKNISNGKNTMSDFDWLDENSNEVSKYSYHSKTNLNNLEKLDISVLKYVNNYFLIQLGYKSYKYDWTAFGGEYSYMDDINNNIKVISYTQDIKMTYLNIGINKKYKDISFELKAGYSNNVKINTHDTHHLKNRSYYDYFKNGKSTFILFKIGYDYSKTIEYFISYSYENIDKINGYSITKNNTDNQILSISNEDFVSTNHTSNNYTFGVKINF